MITVTSSLLEIKWGIDNYRTKAVALLQKCNLHLDLYQHSMTHDRDPDKMTSKGNKNMVAT